MTGLPVYMSANLPAEPWKHLPNPFGFPEIGEQAQHIHYPMTPIPGSKTKAVQRTSPYAKDWLGVLFSKGDLVLTRTSDIHKIMEVEEIFLDDARGNPYTADYYHRLAVHKASGLLYIVETQWQGPTVLKEVDPSWIGYHLGLVARKRDVLLPPEFESVEGQGYRARCMPIDGNIYSARKSIEQKHLSVFGVQIDRATTELYQAARVLPLTGREIKL